MTNQELIDLWRKSKEPSFVKWLDKKEQGCQFCETPCNQPWCPHTEESDENTQSE